MAVRVKVLSFRAQPVQDRPEASIDKEGGWIGRREGNALVLADDASISREHGRIYYEDGAYKYHDSSSNGTRLENYNKVIHNESVILRDGDRLGIGDYELMVVIESSDQWLGDPRDSGGDGIGNNPQDPEPNQPPGTKKYPITVAVAGSDAFDELRDLICPKGGNESNNDDLEAPGISMGPVAEPNSDPEPEDPGPNSSINNAMFRHILIGAGLEKAHFAQEVDHIEQRLQQVGKLLRAFVEGLSIALQARADMKRQMRVSVTTIDANDNNPLKFSANIDQALAMMLGLNARGFKDPIAAVQEGFSDLVNHQLAMAAGMQGSLLGVLKRFDPEKIEQSCAEGIVFQKKSKCWENYCTVYPKLVDGALEDIFGEDFVAIYERQLAQLRATQRQK